jgi:hypothetical protein
VAGACLFALAGGCGRADSRLATGPIVTTTTSTTPTTLPPPTTPPCPSVPVPAAGPTTLATQTVAAVSYYDGPGGRAVRALQMNRWGGPTVRPVIATQGAWLQVRLDYRPNGSTVWVRQQDMTLTTTTYHIVVSVCRRSLTLFQDGQMVHTAPVGVGQPQWATPVGPSYVSAVVATPKRQLYTYGPTVLILATHSNVFNEFDGGDGTVGIHAYPSDPASTRGVMSSHGCVRVAPTTIDAIKVVPVGTPVDIST